MSDTRPPPDTADVGVLRRTEVFSFGALLVGGLTVLVYLVLGTYSARPYPFNTPLFFPDDQLVDGQPGFAGHYFSDYWSTITQSGKPSPYPSLYFPFAHIFLRPLSHLSIGWGLLLYVVFVLCVCSAIGLYASPGLPKLNRARTVLLLGLFSYPVLFLVDRGNVEGIVLAFVVVAALTYERLPYVAAVAIALGAAFKLLPLLLIALLLAQRRFRAALLACSLAAVLTLTSAAVFKGGAVANLRALGASLRQFGKDGLTEAGLQHASDLPGTFLVLTGTPEGVVASTLVMLLSLSMMAAAALWVIWARPAATYAVSVLLIVMVIAPHPAFDYRLVHLLLPAALFLRNGYATGRDGLVSVLWVIALAPMSVPILFGEVGIGVVARPLILVALLGIVVHAHHATGTSTVPTPVIEKGEQGERPERRRASGVQGSLIR